jgi:triacylglycerol lipase
VYYPNEFDRNRAIELAELIKQAYDQLEASQRQVAWKLQGDYSLVSELRYSQPKTPPRKGTRTSFDNEFREWRKAKSHGAEGLPMGFIACHKNDTYLIFRGSMITTEWISDFTIHLTPYPYAKFGKVHEGFLQTYEAFRKTIKDGLDGIRHGRKLFIAGYSGGAALATLTAPDIVSSTSFKTPTIYTFGSPRVGDMDFALAFNHVFKEKAFRIANTCDLITLMPFPVPFMGFVGGYYTHVETPIDFTMQEESIEKNHELDTYLKALQADRGRDGLLRRLLNGRPTNR